MSNFNAPIVYNGDFAKVLKSKLKLADGFQLITGLAVDPTAVATDAPAGSILIHSSTLAIYKKLDAGSTTNWKDLNQSALEFMGAITNDPTGFVDRTTSTLSWDDGTRTFTVAPTGSTFAVYIKGSKLNLTSKSVVFTDTEGLWYAYINSAGTLVATQTFDVDTMIISNAFVASWYWDADNNLSIVCSDERHGIYMDSATHSYLHSTFGTRFISGLALNTFSINTGAAGTVVTGNAQFGSDAGVIADEDIRHSLSAVVSTTGFPVFYKSGASGAWRRQVADGVPVSFTATRANWNNINAGGAGVWGLTAVTSNGDYFLMHLFATNDVNQPVIALVGQAQYTSTALARTGATEELNTILTSGLPLVEFKAIGTVIYQTDSGYTGVTKRVRVTEAVAGGADYVDWRTSQVAGNLAGVTDHGTLSGLSDDDHLQYHNDTRGDVRYYTKAEHKNSSAGAGDAGKPIVLDAEGKIDDTMIKDADIDHGSIGGLSDDDHTQYVLANGTRAITGQQTFSAGAKFNSAVTPFEFNQGGVINPTASGYSSMRPDDYGQYNVVGYDGTNYQKEVVSQSGHMMRARNATGTRTADGTTWNTVIFDTENFDEAGAYSTSTGIYTIPANKDDSRGYYRVTCVLSVDFSAGSGFWKCSIWTNAAGSDAEYSRLFANVNEDYTTVTITDIIKVDNITADRTIAIKTQFETGQTATYVNDNGASINDITSIFMVEKIRGIKD